MAGLAILKHMHDLSDEALCDRWVENPYYCPSSDGLGHI
jgi:IS5 family transposase